FHDSGRDITAGSVVDVFFLFPPFLLSRFAKPIMFFLDESVGVDTFFIVFCAEITFYNKRTHQRCRNRTKQKKPPSDVGFAGLFCSLYIGLATQPSCSWKSYPASLYPGFEKPRHSNFHS